MLNTDKELKLYYSIGEVADMFGVNPSLLRFWEKEFPQISPKTAGRGIRQYRKEDVGVHPDTSPFHGLHGQCILVFRWLCMLGIG